MKLEKRWKIFMAKSMNLLDLNPKELLTKELFQYIELKDLLNLSQTCVLFRNIILAHILENKKFFDSKINDKVNTLRTIRNNKIIRCNRLLKEIEEELSLINKINVVIISSDFILACAWAIGYAAYCNFKERELILKNLAVTVFLAIAVALLLQTLVFILKCQARALKEAVQECSYEIKHSQNNISKIANGWMSFFVLKNKLVNDTDIEARLENEVIPQNKT